MATFRILVFGSTGTGKTSLCNSLTGQHMPVNNSARGVTFQSHTFEPLEFGEHSLIVTDTVGLNETENGTISSALAIQQLIKLLHESKDGYNLLIHVMKIPRITKSHKDNYELFYKKIAQQNIPIILVATGCENEEPMSLWANENSHHFINDGFEYKEIVSTCFAEGGRLETVYAPLRNESRTLVIDAILKNGLVMAKKIYIDQPSFDDLLKRAWNYFCDRTGLPEKIRFQVGETSYDLLIRIGIPNDVAEKIAKVDIGEIALKILRKYFGF